MFEIGANSVDRENRRADEQDRSDQAKGRNAEAHRYEDAGDPDRPIGDRPHHWAAREPMLENGASDHDEHDASG